jgi:hypothetical protein
VQRRRENRRMESKDGRLWFPTIRGVVAVEPRIKTNEQPPPVIIEEVIVGGKSVSGSIRERKSESFPLARSLPHPLTIPPGRGQMEIQYTALSLQAPEKNRFKYMLEGIDADWVNAGASRAAHYNNIARAVIGFESSPATTMVCGMKLAPRSPSCSCLIIGRRGRSSW